MTQPSLNEMRRLVAEDDCRMRGHSFDVITAGLGQQPVWVICSRCGKRWAVQ